MQQPHIKKIAVFSSGFVVCVVAVMAYFSPGDSAEPNSFASAPAIDDPAAVIVEPVNVSPPENAKELPDETVSNATGTSASDVSVEESTPIIVQTANASPQAPAAAAPNPPASQESIANDLFMAARDASPEISLGPITACFDQMRAVACPIVGSIPVVKDVVGYLSLELGIYCPTSPSPSRS